GRRGVGRGACPPPPPPARRAREPAPPGGGAAPGRPDPPRPGPAGTAPPHAADGGLAAATAGRETAALRCQAQAGQAAVRRVAGFARGDIPGSVPTETRRCDQHAFTGAVGSPSRPGPAALHPTQDGLDAVAA